MLLGEISPKTRITTVSTTVETSDRSPKTLGEQNGAHGGGRDVHDVVADQVGGQELVVVLRDAQGQGGPLVAAVRPALEPDAVERGKGGLCGGEKGGEDHEDHKSGRSY
jgi:hypothetical protein